MDTLIAAILVIVCLVGAAYVFGAISDGLEKSTGRDLGTWFKTLLGSALLLGVGYGGLAIVQWAMNAESVLVVIVGMLVMGLAGFLIYELWTDDGSSGYDPMSGKRAHYNRDGKLTGYSDKD